MALTGNTATGRESLEELAGMTAADKPIEVEGSVFDLASSEYQDYHKQESKYRWSVGAARMASRGVRPGPSDSMSRSAYGYPEEFGFEVPSLFLGFEPKQLKKWGGEPLDYKLRGEWYALTTQTNGMMCDHPLLIGTPLTIKEKAISGIKGLNDFPNGIEFPYLPDAQARGLRSMWAHIYEEAVTGHRCPSGAYLPDAKAYEVFVGAHLGCSVDTAFADMREGYYTLDPTIENIRLLSEIDVPEDFREFFETDELFFTPRFTLVVMGENCD